jgi:hypothetical protein
LQLARTLPSGSAERAPLLGAVLTDALAAYGLRADAARLSAPRTQPSFAGSEFALLSSGAVTREAASQPYQVEARIEAASKAADPEIKLRFWREALAIAPSDERVRVGALRAALELRRDSLALALDQARPQSPSSFSQEFRSYNRRVLLPRIPEPRASLTDAENASLAESLAEAAERLDDLTTAQTQLRAAIALRPQAERGELVAKLDTLTAELARRTKNAARQPAIKDVIEQDRVVRPRIPRNVP